MTVVKTEMKIRKQEINTRGCSHGVGRRKASTARAWVKIGNGDFKVNGLDASSYFDNRKHYINHVMSPLNCIGDLKVDVSVNASGGGKTGHAGATRLALSNALVRLNPDFYTELRSSGYMTCDTRKVLRKKPGFRKHSKRPPTSRR